jgi:hypothetical protein
MADPLAPPASTPPAETSLDGARARGLEVSRTGSDAPPVTSGGRAHAFREKQAQRRSVRRERAGQLLVVAIILLGLYAIITAKPFNPSSSSSPQPGPPVKVTLGAPVTSTVPCGAGGTAYVERIPWLNSSAPVTTGEVVVRVYELVDGDYIVDTGTAANVTHSSLCAGVAPSASLHSWYGVLAAGNGTNLLSYTQSQGWVSPAQTGWIIPIANGSTLILVSGTSMTGWGLGIAIAGFANGSQISGSVPL